MWMNVFHLKFALPMPDVKTHLDHSGAVASSDFKSGVIPDCVLVILSLMKTDAFCYLIYSLMCGFNYSLPMSINEYYMLFIVHY